MCVCVCLYAIFPPTPSPLPKALFCILCHFQSFSFFSHFIRERVSLAALIHSHSPLSTTTDSFSLKLESLLLILRQLFSQHETKVIQACCQFRFLSTVTKGLSKPMILNNRKDIQDCCHFCLHSTITKKQSKSIV